MHNLPYFLRYFLLSEILNSSRAVEKRFSPFAKDISTMNRESTQFKKTIQTRSTVHGGNAVLTTEETLQTIQINNDFLLAGLGAVLLMLLFIMSIELQFAKRKLAHLKRNVNQRCNETTNQPLDGSFDEINEQNDTVYNEMEFIELMQPKSSSEAGDSAHNLDPVYSKETSFIEKKDDDVDAPKNGLEVLLFTKST